MSKGNENIQQSLAMMRTDLANERTLLAYGCTSLIFTATGVTLIKFFPLSLQVHTTGWVLGSLGLTYRRTGNSKIRQNAAQASAGNMNSGVVCKLPVSLPLPSTCHNPRRDRVITACETGPEPLTQAQPVMQNFLRLS